MWNDHNSFSLLKTNHKLEQSYNDDIHVKINGSFDFDICDRSSELVNSINNVYRNRSFNDSKIKINSDLVKNEMDFANEDEENSIICKRNIERWIRQGVKRKKGAGRKTVNPQMEANIVEWVTQYLNDHSFLIRAPTEEERNHKPSKGL